MKGQTNGVGRSARGVVVLPPEGPGFTYGLMPPSLTLAGEVCDRVQQTAVERIAVVVGCAWQP